MKLPTLQQTQTVLIIGGVAIAAYLAWMAYKAARAGAAAVSDTYAAARTGTTNLLERIAPLTPVGPMITYAIRFPEDGKLHAVNGEDIDKSGFFYRDGKKYLLQIDAYGQRIAVPQ